MENNKFTAINIGPIIKTLGMARKPRELWAASYLFSYLMKRIVEALSKENIISPALFDPDEKNGVGLYPDRVFVKGVDLSYDAIEEVLIKFAVDLELDSDYFNLMMVSGEYEKDTDAIKDLNLKLDCMELFNMATDKNDADNKVRELITLKSDSQLFDDAFGANKFSIETLGEIAAIELSDCQEWKDFQQTITSDDKEISEKAYGKLPKEKLKSYHKYICVVQADGDNVGKTVSHSQLNDGKVKEISEALLQYGKKAKKAIKDYGGFPIYAGGDDLLFIAPVVGEDHSNIFQLLEKIDESFKNVKEAVDNQSLEDVNGKCIQASLSFGISITYYKYPLYEALENARHLLFVVAKDTRRFPAKNAIVVDWRKHSGSSFCVELSGDNSDLKVAFEAVLEASAVEESVVSAVSHKIRESEGLLGLWLGKNDTDSRNGNFFQKYMEHNPNKDEKDKTNSDKYKDAALELLNKLFTANYTDINKLTKNMYAMLRLAKFISGEEVKDD